jgi:ornithine cyclodeaminase/alanine dehydrogenase-like protein (mu-crystallin family)
VDPAWARGGSFISLVDLGRAWKIAATGGPVIADDCEQFHYLRSIDRLHVLGEPMALSEVLGSDESVRSTDDPTVFVPTGYGAADLAIVELLVDAALRKGVGHSLSLD